MALRKKFQDNNGTIELDEFLSMMAMRMKTTEKIKQVFDHFDKNSDGLVRPVFCSLQMLFTLGLSLL